MHFQIIRDKYYFSIVKELSNKVPEFKSIFTEEDEIYPVLAEFRRFIIYNINNKSIMEKSFQFINYAIEAGGIETEDAIVLQIFQPIYDNQQLVLKLEPWLQGKALKIFLFFKDKYNQI